jgi:hypothetical protein
MLVERRRLSSALLLVRFMRSNQPADEGVRRSTIGVPRRL